MQIYRYRNKLCKARKTVAKRPLQTVWILVPKWGKKEADALHSKSEQTPSISALEPLPGYLPQLLFFREKLLTQKSCLALDIKCKEKLYAEHQTVLTSGALDHTQCSAAADQNLNVLSIALQRWDAITEVVSELRFAFI